MPGFVGAVTPRQFPITIWMTYSLKAALVYKGVAVDPKLKKAELSALLARELRGSGCSNYSASFVADPSAEVEPTAADFVDSSDDAASDCGSVSSEWPHSEADDH